MDLVSMAILGLYVGLRKLGAYPVLVSGVKGQGIVHKVYGFPDTLL